MLIKLKFSNKTKEIKIKLFQAMDFFMNVALLSYYFKIR